MKTFEQKLVMILADPQLSDAQFRDAARLLSSEGVHRAIRAAEELRSHMRRLFRNSGTDEGDDELYERLKKLLLTERRMKSIDALRALARELEFVDQFPAKCTFRKGLKRLLKSADASALLGAAERISDQKTEHGWPLITGGKLDSGDGNL